MNKHQEYLSNLQKEKWIKVKESFIRNCEHPTEEYLTCGEYEKGTFLLKPQSGSIKVPKDYCQRSGLWICPKHLSNYEIKDTN